MRQFVLPPNYDGEGGVKISGADAKYILRVLRLKAGDSFPGVNRTGDRFTLRITETGGNFFTASVSADRGGKAMPETVLIQCLPKGKKLELIIRQAVEAGVSMIIPVESENSVPRIHQDRADKRQIRLEKIAEEAAQQSGNRGVPEICSAVKMKDLPKSLEEKQILGTRLFFHQKRLAQNGLHSYLDSEECEPVCILIGPEGGLSGTETDFLLASDFYPVYLGENVLRTETAAIYALGAVNTILLEKRKWTIDIRE